MTRKFLDEKIRIVKWLSTLTKIFKIMFECFDMMQKKHRKWSGNIAYFFECRLFLWNHVFSHVILWSLLSLIISAYGGYNLDVDVCWFKNLFMLLLLRLIWSYYLKAVFTGLINLILRTLGPRFWNIFLHFSSYFLCTPCCFDCDFYIFIKVVVLCTKMFYMH